MAKILIIGGTRYLGLEITKLFAEEKLGEVYVLNRGITGSPLPEGTQRLTCNVNNSADLMSAVSALKPNVLIDTILSAAALENLLPRLGSWLEHFIHTGSIGVYGNTGYLPATEKDQPKPALPVFQQKLAQDQVVLKYVRQSGLPATILRISYIFGRGDVPLELWGGRNPEFFRRLRRGEEVLAPGDGRTLLHPGHVTDLAKSFRLCLGNKKSIGQVYNIGGERSVTLAKYLEVIGAALGVTPKVNWQPVSQAAEALVKQGLAGRDDLLFLMEHLSVDITKAKLELGYRPAISLEDGLNDNVNWLRAEGKI